MISGERLKNLRKENRLSQEKLADLVGVSRQAVSKWETGLSNPDTENLIKLGEVFHLSMDEIVGRGFAKDEVSDETSEKTNKLIHNKILLILGSITGFLAFAVGITFAESNSLFVLVGMAGTIGMSYCISNIIKLT